MDKTENSAPEALCAKLSVQSLWHPLLRFFFFWRKRICDLSCLFIKMARPHTIFVLASRCSQCCLTSFAGLTMLGLSVRCTTHEEFRALRS